MKNIWHTHKNFNSVVLHFTPNWFTASMGTGMAAICLNVFSANIIFYNAARIIWQINIILFLFFITLFILKTLYYPNSWIRLLKNASQPMFLGAIPMALATIINGCIYFINDNQHLSIDLAFNLWIVDIILALLCLIVVPYFMFKYQTHTLKDMTAIWLLPFVACNVVALTGTVILNKIEVSYFLLILVISFILWAISIVLALGILFILFQRLVLHQLPNPQIISTMWLPLGPTGTGSLAIYMIGKFLIHPKFIGLFSADTLHMLQITYVICIFIAVILCAIGSWWLIIAILSTFGYIRRELISFNLGFWGFTFPFGSYIMSCVGLAKLSEFKVLTYYCNVLICIYLIVWLSVFIRTLIGAYHGYLFKDDSIET